MSSKYKAFISYSRDDEGWARWLQRRLEHYRVPARLIEAQRGRRELPRRLYPVFRDRSELSSSSDLGATLKQALRDSDCLVVICSPAAAASRWLDEEVRYFQSLGRADRILCFAVDGDLDVNSPHCAFPRATIGKDEAGNPVEPLAADPRSDGRGDALLKIVGGLLGVGIDELKQRDAQRRARRWASLAALALVLAIAMVALAIAALAARHEAELRRGQAENLIGFMLGDLRSRLEPIGRLDLLDAVGDASLQYFAALDENATPEDLLGRGMALRQIGEVRFTQGKLESALQAFRESRAVLQSLYEADPGVDDYLFEMGQSEFWVGYVHYERLELDEALEAMNNYLSISEQLRNRQPENPDYLVEVSYAYTNLSAVARKRNDRQGAIHYARQAAAISEQQLEADGTDDVARTDLADNYSWLGSAEEDLGNLEASINAFEHSLAQWRILVDAGHDTRHRERWGATALLLANTQLLAGNLVAAEQLIDDAYTEFSALVATDPDNAGWRRGLAVGARSRAEVACYGNRLDLALASVNEALGFFDQLATDDPSNRQITQQIAIALRLQAEIFAVSGRPGDALAAAEASLERAQQTVSDMTSSPAAETLASTAVFARLLDRAGRPQDARALRTAAWQATAATGVPRLRAVAPLAEITRSLGEDEAAAQLIARLRAAGYRHPGYASLLGLD